MLGVDAVHTKDVRTTHKLLVKHVLAIRAMPIFSQCRLVFIFECARGTVNSTPTPVWVAHCPTTPRPHPHATRSNLAFESQHLLHAIEAARVKNWVSLSEGQQGTLGWLTTAERKESMCLLMRECLTVGKIALSGHFFSIELADKEARMRIQDELNSYCVVTEPPKTTFGKVTPHDAAMRRPVASGQ